MSEHVLETVKNFLRRYNLLKGQKTIVVGFSGGYDSLCLLDILNKLSQNFDFKLIAAHLNHNWRGEESLQEQKNAEAYCLENDIKFLTKNLSSELPQTELEARNQRYQYFTEIADEYSVTAILTGHTLTDNAETIIYRVIKGTGIQGLTGIPESRKLTSNCTIYRPLLDITREQTVKYCQDNELKANEDSSNLDSKYARNNIRLNLFPGLKKYNKDVEKALIRMSLLAKESEEIVKDRLLEIKKELYISKNEIDTSKFIKLSNSIQKRFIYELLIENKLEYDTKKIDEINNFIKENIKSKSGKTHSITQNTWLFVSFKVIKIIYRVKSDVIESIVKVDLEGKTIFKDLKKVLTVQSFDDINVSFEYPDETSKDALVDLSGISEPLYLRTRRAGDKIQPFGMKEKVKLKKYLINKGIPEFQRDELILLATDSEVIWVVGVGLSENARVIKNPTHFLRVEKEEK